MSNVRSETWAAFRTVATEKNNGGRVFIQDPLLYLHIHPPSRSELNNANTGSAVVFAMQPSPILARPAPNPKNYTTAYEKNKENENKGI